MLPAAERIAQGLDERGFEALLDWVMDQLGDDHSYVESPPGNAEEPYGFDLRDGWRVRVATDAFRPSGGEAGAWEHTGIAPDVQAPSRWGLFTEAANPGLAAAIDLLARD